MAAFKADLKIMRAVRCIPISILPPKKVKLTPNRGCTCIFYMLESTHGSAIHANKG